MSNLKGLAQEHLYLSRRYFLRLAGAGAVISQWPQFAIAGDADHPALAEAIAKLEYLTPPENFGTVERGNPLPYTHPEEKLREVGLTRETWQLEVLPDPEAPPQIAAPLSKDAATALNWDALMKLAEQHAVRFLKVMTCNNGNSPLGMGLWEGVPLREVIWLTKPTGDLRRVFYYGYHNDELQQRFQSSLPIGRVLEDSPGDHPVTLCYKLNGEWLSGKRGGPVRMIVPESYGFKSVKWLQKIILTNAPFANDTYASGNNDVDSWMKTFARFLRIPSKAQAGQAVPITGVAQVGISGLQKVQYWLEAETAPHPTDDPNFATAPWQDAEILSPPNTWGGGLAEDKLPRDVRGIDSKTGKPAAWPQRYTIVHWAALVAAQPAGKYQLRCRTIDANGVAQPLPRPFPKSGRNSIQKLPLTVVSA